MEKDLEKNLSSLVDETRKLNDAMYSAVADYVNSKGGFIDARNGNAIYGFTCDTMVGDNIEFRIIAIKTDGDCVYVLFDRYNYDVDYDDMSYDEFKDYCLNDCGDFSHIFDGYILQNATLYNICDNISSCVSDK